MSILTCSDFVSNRDFFGKADCSQFKIMFIYKSVHNIIRWKDEFDQKWDIQEHIDNL
jgi:hypothetical protein